MREEALAILATFDKFSLPASGYYERLEQLAKDIVELVDYLAPRSEDTKYSFVFNAVALYDNDKVVAIRQHMADGTIQTFSIGDKTDIGTIVGFERAKATPPYDLWYALGDAPSDWQKDCGMKNSWSWVYQLEKVTE